jgi:uncharacterized protein with PIN domain
MLGGLARWLRAIGYDAAFEYGINDADLIDRAAADGRVVLSSDGGLFERNVLKNGQVQGLYVPQQLSRTEQLRFVVSALHLVRRDARCMACGGELTQVPKHTVMDEAPPLAFRSCERFWRCQNCSKLLWRGTHWQKIETRLAEILKT